MSELTLNDLQNDLKALLDRYQSKIDGASVVLYERAEDGGISCRVMTMCDSRAKAVNARAIHTLDEVIYKSLDRARGNAGVDQW